jgi:hypothetical protein
MNSVCRGSCEDRDTNVFGDEVNRVMHGDEVMSVLWRDSLSLCRLDDCVMHQRMNPFCK